MRLVVIDSLNGYMNAMPEERYLTLHLHELLTYLSQRGVATLVLVSVVKKRSGPHERAIREFHLGADGIHVGAPLTEFRDEARGA